MLKFSPQKKKKIPKNKENFGKEIKESFENILFLTWIFKIN